MNCIVSGASSGIGREMVSYLLRTGHQVLAIARREELLKSLTESIEQEGETSKSSSVFRPQSLNLHILKADLSLESSIKEVRQAIESWEKVDVLINNAGQLINKAFLESSAENFMDQFKANVVTAVNLIKAADPYLRRGSHIVNISSMGGFQGSSKYAGLSAYSSSKGALSVLTECLAEEYKLKGISVNALALGAVQTEMLKKAFPDYNPNMSPQKMAAFIADFALNSGSVMSGRIIPVATANP